MYNKVVRVAVNNNFNCTSLEYRHLDALSKENPESYFFTNSNIKTPKLININNHDYKAVITINPDLVVQDNMVRRLYDITSDKVAFVRVKYIPGWISILNLIERVSLTHKVVLTMQRFNSIKSISQYVPDFRKYYTHSDNRFRLNEESFRHITSYTDTLKNVYICDRAGIGCEGCGLCSILTVGEDLPIHSLNLSTSGLCKYNCPDCYAKTMQNFLKKTNRPEIHYDWIHKNSKQSGKTKHIKRNKKAA